VAASGHCASERAGNLIKAALPCFAVIRLERPRTAPRRTPDTVAMPIPLAAIRALRPAARCRA
jgi:hypothetical protein